MDCGTHGVCYGGVCRCEDGWTGSVCDQKACHPMCSKNGVCKEGKCECDQGWTGEHCNIGEYSNNHVVLFLKLVLTNSLFATLMLTVSCFKTQS